ncbi:MAG: hypothetical protein AB8B87_01710 [Granulosicoccus sp.]
MALLCAGSVHAFTLNLEPAKWHSLSASGSDSRTTAQMFAGQLNPNQYGSQWTVFLFDDQTQQYSQAALNSPIEPGAGFWFVHMSDNAIQLEIDVFAPTVPLSTAAPCQASFGCHVYPLPSLGSSVWSLLGVPFPEGVEVQDVMLVTDSGTCQNGCTLQQAIDAGLAASSFYRFDAESLQYVAVPANDLLQAGDGYWLPTSIPPSLGAARLLFPTYCTPFS